jgi:hypothetical protein
MQYISLNNSSLSTFVAKGKLSELSGSSKYQVFDKEIIKKEFRPKNKIEKTSALTDYLNVLLSASNLDSLILRISINYCILWKKRLVNKGLNEVDSMYINFYSDLLCSFMHNGSEFLIKYKLQQNKESEAKQKFTISNKEKKDYYVINKSKVKGKIFALFNLKISNKFVAFYSVSFPANNNDNVIFECWNSWLTLLRKQFNLKNYIWISERQKNGTLHYHMFTNHFLPIQQINRGMAIIINNKVIKNEMTWNNANIDNYNGVDVDSIYGSKRHKNSGKTLNRVQVRQWLTSYITKYVTKNTEKFQHLCWHCSRSISALFTSQVFELNSSYQIINSLPFLALGSNKLMCLSEYHYIYLSSEFNDTYIFKFNPPPEIFQFIILYNNLISAEFEPQYYKTNKMLNHKSITII